MTDVNLDNIRISELTNQELTTLVLLCENEDSFTLIMNEILSRPVLITDLEDPQPPLPHIEPLPHCIGRVILRVFSKQNYRYAHHASGVGEWFKFWVGALLGLFLKHAGAFIVDLTELARSRKDNFNATHK